MNNTKPHQDKAESAASAFATEMVHSHNIFIRGLNSMTRQAVNVIEAKDIEDFMLYVKTWIKHRIHVQRFFYYSSIC